MKQIIISILLAVMALPLMAANANIDKANQAYKQELYNEALQLYLQEAKGTGVSSALYCNIGDTYYRLKDNVHAVLYYERALVLDPSNSDARFNLDFVRGKMQLPDDAGDSWFSNWVDQNAAIIMPESVVLSTAPREARDKDEEAFSLQQGTRVEIVDSITGKDSGKWLQVSTAGGHKAWLKANDIEVI